MQLSSYDCLRATRASAHTFREPKIPESLHPMERPLTSDRKVKEYESQASLPQVSTYSDVIYTPKLPTESC